MGGVNYFRNLSAALASLERPQIELVLFAGYQTNTHDMEKYVTLVRTSLLDRRSVAWAVRQVIAKPTRDVFLYRLLKTHNISFISHYQTLWSGCPIASLPWIPDFQHLHLPQLFDDTLINVLNKANRQSGRTSEYILLSSECACRDYEIFMADEPGHAATPRIMHFYSCLVGEQELLKKNELMAQYDLPEYWFYLPNQFWKHKNHTVVVEALAELRVQGKKICVVATGSKNDHRNPGYFDALMDSVSQQQLEEQFICLGMVPYPHMLALMKYAMAVINPSFFEGWSTTVEEAKALGKCLILSEIPVHREQNPNRACFFEADDSHALAETMSHVVESFDASDDNVFIQEAEGALADHRTAFGKQYESIILDCMSRP